MKSRVTLHPVFILHTRPFKDTSLLVDALTMEHGRISLLARGVRKARTPLRGILQPFVPLLMSWSGNTELVSMSKAEAVGLPYALKGKALISGFYLNELVMRLLHRYDSHPNLYKAYQNALIGLQESNAKNHAIELVLRLFEQYLLKELGYGFKSEMYEIENNREVLRNTKHLMRTALQALLGDRVLKSRELFI